jgi:hypothetical protein
MLAAFVPLSYFLKQPHVAFMQTSCVAKSLRKVRGTLGQHSNALLGLNKQTARKPVYMTVSVNRSNGCGTSSM